MFARLTGAARRVGPADAREGGWIFYTERHGPGGASHSVDRMLEVLRGAGVPPIVDTRLYPGEAARAALARDRELAGRRYAILAPTSRWPGKRWPIERFASLAPQLLARGYERVVIVGSRTEREQCEPLLHLAASDPRVVDRVGSTSIAELMAMIEHASLVVANDSAVLHMSVGLARPLIALYGPTDTATVGPYGRRDDVLQHVQPGERFDHKDRAHGESLMRRIEVDEVVSRVDRLLSHPSPST